MARRRSLLQQKKSRKKNWVKTLKEHAGPLKLELSLIYYYRYRYCYYFISIKNTKLIKLIKTASTQ